MPKKNRNRRLPWLASSLLAGGVLLGTMLGAAAQDAPVSGGTLVYLEQVPHTALYPPSVGFYPNGGVIAQIADRLTWQDPKTFEIQPWIAESWEINADATQYTFKLRPGVTFSDGTPLDAAAVAANFDAYGRGNMDLKQTISEAINNYDHSEVIDPLTVTFHFSNSSPGFLQATSTITSGLLALKSLAMPIDEFGDATKIIGSGPFIVESEVLGKEINYVARKDYNWGPSTFEHQGAPLLDGIKVIVTPEDGVRIGGLLAGQADIMRVLQAYDEPQVQAVGYNVVAAGTHGMNNAMFLHPENPVVSDIRVRRALIAAIDRQEIVDTVYSENYPIARSIIAADVPGFVDLSAEMTYDQEKAKALFAEAGWAVGPSGFLEKDGLVLELSGYEALGQPQNKAMLQLAAQHLAAVGVKLNILPGDAGGRVADNADPTKTTFEPTMVGRADADVIKSALHPKNRDLLLQAGGKSAGTVFIDAELNGILEQIAAETDPTKRLALVEQVQRHVIENAYLIPFFEEPQTYAMAPYVHGFAVEAVGRPVFYGTWLAPH